jgi:hypothetical protein
MATVLCNHLAELVCFLLSWHSSSSYCIYAWRNPETTIVVSGGFGAKIESRLCQTLLQMLIRTLSGHASSSSISDQVQTRIALANKWVAILRVVWKHINPFNSLWHQNIWTLEQQFYCIIENTSILVYYSFCIIFTATAVTMHTTTSSTITISVVVNLFK